MAGTYLLEMIILFLNKFIKQLLRFKKKIEFPMPQQKAVSKIFTRTKKDTINRNHEFRES
jgi:hypothetical protein